MNNQTMKRALVIAIAGIIGLGATAPSWSAPVSSATTAVKAAAPSAVSDVRYRNRGYSRNTGAAAAVGILGVAGALAAQSAYRHNSYGYPGYYQQGYAPGYYQQGYAPGYYQQGYAPGYYQQGYGGAYARPGQLRLLQQLLSGGRAPSRRSTQDPGHDGPAPGGSRPRPQVPPWHGRGVVDRN